jgi:hypothetical protein
VYQNRGLKDRDVHHNSWVVRGYVHQISFTMLALHRGGRLLDPDELVESSRATIAQDRACASSITYRIRRAVAPDLWTRYRGGSQRPPSRLARGSAAAFALLGRLPRPADRVRRVRARELDAEYEEGWERPTQEPELRGVEAFRSDDADWPWQVTVSAAHLSASGALEHGFRHRLHVALQGVPGVTAVAEEDRELWLVAGRPSGRALVVAAASIVDEAARIAERAD